MNASDGAGVKLKRSIGTPEADYIDPFLMLDEFGSENKDDYIGGFPPHPHRGIETVTYMLNGEFEHEDSTGAKGRMSSGDVQWMKTGGGIIHSEMPEQESGLLKGFQLWVNLPKKHKMTTPHYQEFAADKITVEKRSDGGEIRVISGSTNNNATGAVVNNYVKPTYLHVTLPANASFEQNIAKADNTFIYMISGHLCIGDSTEKLDKNQLGILTEGTSVKVVTNTATSFLLVSAMPLNEPLARSGPFVMNSKAEIIQAYSDLQNNRF